MTNCQSILVVDDNNDVRETIVHALLFEGYKVFGAANGKEALKRLAQLAPPTLVLLDLMMPEMNGWEVIEKIRNDAGLTQNVIVTMSAVDLRYTPQDAPHLMVDSSLQKPVSLNTLFEKVEEYCGLPGEGELTAAATNL